MKITINHKSIQMIEMQKIMLELVGLTKIIYHHYVHYIIKPLMSINQFLSPS